MSGTLGVQAFRRSGVGHAQAQRNTSYTVCLDKFNSLAIIATFFFSAFIFKIMLATVGVTLLGVLFGLPPCSPAAYHRP